jgi:branched-chain amino acid transport system permease protein
MEMKTGDKLQTINTQQKKIGTVIVWILIAVVIIGLILVPQLTNNSGTLSLLFLILIFITLSQSWNILGGYAGQISLGHAAFFGIGALVMRALWIGGMEFFVAMPIAATVAALCAIIVGVPTFRLRGAYFSIGTLALAEALRLTVANVLPTVSMMPTRFIATFDMVQRYYVALAVALITMLVAFLLLRSPWMLGWLAIREDEEAAQATGVQLLWHKLAASCISSFLAGLAGAAFSFQQVSYYPSAVFAATWTFDPVLIAFIGGVGTLIGPVVGAIFFIAIREQLVVTLPNLHPIIFGIMFIIIVLVFPGGLVDIGERLKQLILRNTGNKSSA